MNDDGNMELRIEDSFETLTQSEWDNFLSVDFFENMYIN